ncbi:pentapeptide repeat-containing protein [Streptomyces sp. NPDC051907]|uniref:pentapeptide repeat-containing protein n=1 Tax=Streptomyces sp. NPDC051907 TaxID=3155284 RepID=UPI003433B860
MFEAIWWALVAVLVVLGVYFALRAWRMALKERGQEPRIEVLAAVGGGLLSGLAVGLAVLLIQRTYEDAQRYSIWKSGVEVADRIPGFTPGERAVKDINFSGKDLRNADFTDADLQGTEFRDANLRGAVFDSADLRDANLIGADLTYASFAEADLRGALLQDARFSFAIVSENLLVEGAQVNARTCWPATLIDDRLRGVEVTDAYDVHGVRQHDSDDEFVGGQQYPCRTKKG